MADRLRADDRPVELFQGRWQRTADLDLLDLCPASGVRVAEPDDQDKGTAHSSGVPLVPWLSDTAPGARDLTAVAEQPVFRALLSRSVGGIGDARGQRLGDSGLARLAAHPVLSVILREWLTARAEEYMAARGLPGLRTALNRLLAFRTVVADVAPEAVRLLESHDVGRNSRDDAARWLALDHDPTGAFGPVPGFTLDREHVHRQGIARDRLTRLTALVREKGPAPWRPEAAEAFHTATGIGPLQSTALLSAAVEEPGAEALALLGTKTRAFETAQARLDTLPHDDRHALLRALLPQDPAELWSTGPDVRAAAEVWHERLASLVRVPEELDLDLSGTTAGAVDLILNAGSRTWLTHGTDVQDGTGRPGLRRVGARGAVSGALTALRTLAYTLPHGHPLRAHLPVGLAALRSRLADPHLVLDLGMDWSESGGWIAPVIRAAHGLPESGGADADGLVRAGTALLLAPGHGNNEKLLIRPGRPGRPRRPGVRPCRGHRRPSRHRRPARPARTAERGDRRVGLGRRPRRVPAPPGPGPDACGAGPGRRGGRRPRPEHGHCRPLPDAARPARPDGPQLRPLDRVEAGPGQEGAGGTRRHRPRRGGEARPRRPRSVPPLRLARTRRPRAAAGDLEGRPVPRGRFRPDPAPPPRARAVRSRLGTGPRRRRPRLRRTRHPRHPGGPPPMTDDTTTTMDSTTTDGIPGQATAPGREHRQVTPPEDRYATELAFLAAHDPGPRPPGWLLTPAPSSPS
ncbi:hypothetical protein SMICM304S_10094 [Streptomyces microflavus]